MFLNKIWDELTEAEQIALIAESSAGQSLEFGDPADILEAIENIETTRDLTDALSQ